MNKNNTEIPMKTKISLYVCLGIFLNFVIPKIVSSQPVPVGTSSLQFLKIESSARAAAMSGAFVSVATGSNGSFWNPALLIKSNQFDFGINHTIYLFETNLTSFSTIYPVSSSISVGLFGLYMDYGEIVETQEDLLGFNPDGTYNPGLTGRILNPMSMYVGVSGAFRLTDRFTFGLSTRFLREDLVEAAVNSWSVDGGFLFESGIKSINMGVAVRNFGPEVKFGQMSFPIPMTIDIGVSAYLISPEPALITMPGMHRLLVSGSLQHPRDDDQQFKVGLEYSMDERYYLRGGYKFNYDTERWAIGAGIRFLYFDLDYSYSDFGQYLDGVNRFSFTFRI